MQVTAIQEAQKSAPLTRADVRQPLTDFQVAQFRSEGFLKLESPQLSPDEVAAASKILNRLFDEGVGANEGRQFDIAPNSKDQRPSSPQILGPSNYASELLDFPFRIRALSIAKQLLGPDALFCGEHATRKAPHGGGATPWHQDAAYRHQGYHFEELSIWIALDDATVEKGAMQYIPGSHLGGILEHGLADEGPSANALRCVADFDTTASVHCPLPPGGMVVHNIYTLHYAGCNLGDSARLGYVLCFERPTAIAGGAKDFPWMVNLRLHVRKRQRAWLIRGGVLVAIYRRIQLDLRNRRKVAEFGVFSRAKISLWLKNLMFSSKSSKN